MPSFFGLVRNIIAEEKSKEMENKMWSNSIFSDITTLQKNNVGRVGEYIVEQFCKKCNVPAEIDGFTTKTRGGGCGDGTIFGFSVEIKTAFLGKSLSYQHELGEKPWITDYLLFLDISPTEIYITVMKNFTEYHYKNLQKCSPYFPTRAICWRKKCGSFKLDTTPQILAQSAKNGFTLCVDLSLIHI